ncbi:Uncharacterised protein [Leclercia adecarboxylata]|uniref:Membrane-associated sensor domain-containing protein n=1 Tax=Leclercia adecarboxylata TaxID=83655 RepID=A0A4U9HSR0_9ENTR|nr:Uncharacterised protein [Leclercia adecarboxylata]
MLFLGDQAEDITWYRARLFETVATVLIIFILLYDVFNLYRASHLKYQQSYQNSIRDPPDPPLQSKLFLRRVKPIAAHRK